jgi:DinB superfamily
MDTLRWFDRKMTFGLPPEMLPFYLERLKGTIPRLENKVSGLSDAQLSTRPDSKWSIKQHIGHLAEVDQVANKRIQEMRVGAAVMSPAVFEPRDYNPWPIADVLALFRTTREENLTVYRAIPANELQKSSKHPRLGVMMTPVDLAWFDAEHDDHHLVKINEIIFTLNKI